MESQAEPPTMEIYKTYVDDVNDLRASRLNETTLRVTIATLFLGAEAYIVAQLLMNPQAVRLSDLDVGTFLPFAAIVIIAFIGIRFCANWYKLIKDLTDTIDQKFTNLRALEETSQDLRDAGAVLFILEYKKRHADYTPPPISEATRGSAVLEEGFSWIAAKNKQKSPVRGAGLSSQNLAEFFSRVFQLSAGVAALAKIVPVLASSGLLTGMVHLFHR